jgi:hypothetical protein
MVDGGWRSKGAGGEQQQDDAKADTGASQLHGDHGVGGAGWAKGEVAAGVSCGALR